MVRASGLATADLPIRRSIGTMREGPLHAALRERYLLPGDKVEVAVGGYVVDILRGDLIIEVQTGNFSGIARKIRDLVASRRVRLVHPIAKELWIVKLSDDGVVASRRRSPLRRALADVFAELVSFPELLGHENFELDIVLTREEELRVFDGRRRWRRRGWARVERRLLDVSETVPLRCAADYMALMPAGLPDEFLTSDLAQALGRPRRVAQQMAYCLRHCGALEERARRGNAVVYSRVRTCHPEPRGAGLTSALVVEPGAGGCVEGEGSLRPKSRPARRQSKR